MVKLTRFAEYSVAKSGAVPCWADNTSSISSAGKLDRTYDDPPTSFYYVSRAFTALNAISNRSSVASGITSVDTFSAKNRDGR